MFSNIFNNVVEKLSGLNPIKTFIKYALDKFLNELINNEITLEDFKNGCLNLTGIGFNVVNVNLKHLISSPYIMHSGSIGNLRIQLPNLSQIVTKSIQIYVNQIIIQLKPNKDFYRNFKQRMKDLQQNMVFDEEQSLPDEQLSENNPMDFFKETLKKILLNIRVRVENITVKVYMNDPGVQRDGDVHYLMLRVPLLNVHKNIDHKKGNLNVEEIKLDIEVPQISVHVVKQQSTSKRKSESHSTSRNQTTLTPPTTQQPNPTSTIQITSPTTIILFGVAEYKNQTIQTDKSIPRVTLSVVTNNKEQKRDIKLSVTGTRLEMMVDPIQLKVLDRLVRQVREFRDIFSYVRKQLNLGQYPHHNELTPVNKRAFSPISSSSSISSSRIFQSRSDDIFSSICMSILEPQQSFSLKSKRPPGLIESMIKQTPDLQRSVSQFNQQFRRQLREKNLMEKVEKEMTTQLRVNNFKKQVDINIQVKSAVIYMLKSTPTISYIRRWNVSSSHTTNSQQSSYSFPINPHIPSSYFMLSAHSISLHIKQDSKLVSLQLSSLKLNDVKLVINKKFSSKIKQSSMMSFVSYRSDEFVDVQSSVEFYKEQEEQVVNRRSGEMGEFVLGDGEHYCCTEILRVSRNQSQTSTSSTCCFYNFMPKSQPSNQSYNSLLYKPSFMFQINKHKHTPVIKLQIIELAVNVNLQILKQLLDVLQQVYVNNSSNDLFGSSDNSTFGDIMSSGMKLNSIDQMDKAENNGNHKMWRKKTMLESRYNFGVDSVIMDNHHPIEQPSKPSIQFKLHEVNISIYQSTPRLQCFCNSTKNGLYLQIFAPKIELKNNMLNLTMRRLVTGSIRVKDSHVSKVKAFLNISSTSGKRQSSMISSSFTLILQKISNQQLNRLFLIISQCSVNINQKDILQTLTIVSEQLRVLNNIIQRYRQLRRGMQEQEMGLILSPLKKRQRKAYPMQYQSQLQIYVPHLSLKMMNMKSLIKDIYLKKSGQTVTIKLNTLVIGLQQKLQLFLNQMRNQQLCLREYIEKMSKYDTFIRDSSIVIELGDGKGVNNYGVVGNYSSNLNNNNNNNPINNNNKLEKFDFKSRNVYFDTIATAISTLSVTISKSSTYQQSSFGNNNNLSSNMKPKQMLASKDKFKFTKKPSHRQSMESYCGSRSVILEEEQQKRVMVNIAQPVYVMGNAMLRLLEHKDTLLELVKKLTPIIQSIKQLPLTSPERKNSTDSEIDKLQSLTIQLSPGKFCLDIRPTFVEQLIHSKQSQKNIQQQKQLYGKDFSNTNNKTKCRQIIFSSSRSFLQLGWEVVEVLIDKRVKSVKCKASCGWKYYFLQHEDREIGTNPVLIRQQDLDRLGFICLLQLSALKLHLTLLPNSKTINLSISTLQFTSSLSTLSYLQLHWQHFINHNLHRNFGLTLKQEQERFQVIEQHEGKNNKSDNGRSNQNGNSSDSSEEWVRLEYQPFHLHELEQQEGVIEDLTQGLQHYRRKAEFKQQLRSYFQQKLFTQPKASHQTQVYLEQLLIKQLKIKIYSGNDFQFITFQSINESQQKKRNRINDSQILKYMEVRVDSLEVVAKSDSLQRQMLEAIVKVENLQVNYSSKREMKNGWLGQKRMEQVVFPVLRNLNSIKVLIETGCDRLCVKMNKIPFDIGFTSEILQLMEQFKRVKSRIANSGWKKIYQKSKLQKNLSNNQLQKCPKAQQILMPKLLLLHIPQNRLNIRLVYKKITILSDQCVISSQFLLNQQLANHEKIQNFVKSWVKNLVLDNIGGLIGGTAINILSDVIMEMLGLGYFLVGLVMGN